MIKYKVSLEDTNQHLINVEIVLNSPLKTGQKFWLPDWIPGSYMIRDFSKNIVELKAFEGTESIELVKKDKSTWSINQSVKSLRLEYKVYAWDLSVRSAHFDDQHCFFNGTSLFLAVKGMESSKHQLNVIASQLAKQENWKVATSMKVLAVNSEGFGDYTCDSYAELIDHPFEIANYIETKFKVDGVCHKMVFSEAPLRVDLDRIANDVKAICQSICGLFGDEKPPFDQYLFSTFVQKNGFGGLEHSSSTALHCSISDLPRIGDDLDKKSKDYQKFLSLCSHEYFHSWNVKRIKPKLFQPYELQQEINTELLWFFEGITSYYDELFLVRSGIISKCEYLDMLGKNITRYIRGRGRKKQSIADSSFDAWTKFYKQDENAPNAIVSYYVKGGLVAFCLDFEIRKLTHNQKSLDDLMRRIWIKYGKKQQGVGEKAIQKETEELVGCSLEEFFNHILYSTDELELQPIFRILGINCQYLPETKSLEVGGYSKKVINRTDKSSLNISHKKNSLGVEIISVFDGGSASRCGLSNKDIIIAIDGYRVNSSELDNVISAYPINSEIVISYFRRDKLYNKTCRLEPTKPNCCYLSFEGSGSNPLFDAWIQAN